MSKLFAKFTALAIMTALLLGTAYALFLNREASKATPAERIMFLVNELTTTPERQQVALDEIVKDGDGAVIYLFRYLDDERPLATNNVKFLNAHSGTSEKYFLTEASSVNELTLRYLCWRTISCDPWFDVNDEARKMVQREKIVKMCNSRYVEPSEPCPRSTKQ